MKSPDKRFNQNHQTGNDGNSQQHTKNPEEKPSEKQTKDLMWLESYPPGCTNLDNRIVKHKGLLIGGFEGSIKYNNDQWSKQYSNFDMKIKNLKMWPRLYFNRIFRGKTLDILITHAPPHGIHDRPDRCHTGFKPYLSFMRRFKPRYLIHGHIHLYGQNEKRRSVYHDTTVINTCGYQVIEV